MELLKGVAGTPGILDQAVAGVEIGRPENLTNALLAQILIELKKLNGSDAVDKVLTAIAKNDEAREIVQWERSCEIARQRNVPTPPHPAELAAAKARTEAKAAAAKADALAPAQQAAAPVTPPAAPEHPNAPADDDAVAADVD